MTETNRCILKKISYSFDKPLDRLRFIFATQVLGKTPDWDSDVPERKVKAKFTNESTGKSFTVLMTDASPISDYKGAPTSIINPKRLIGKRFTIAHEDISARPGNGSNLQTREPISLDP